MGLTFLVAADLHLGKRSTGLPTAATDISSRHTWHLLIQQAIDRRVDAVLLCGDVVDRDNRFFEAIGALKAGFSRLSEAGIEVYMVSGNHDWDVLPGIVDTMDLPAVHLLGRNGKWELALFSRKGIDLQLVAWSFPALHYEGDSLAGLAGVHWDPALPVIAMIHGDLYDPNSKYNPLNSDRLSASGIPTWLLGHIHVPNFVERFGTIMRYPGSMQALNANEQGKHGFLVLEVEVDHRVQITEALLSTARYEALGVNVSHLETKEELRTALVSGMRADALRLLPELEGVSYLSYDLLLTGENDQENLVVQLANESIDDLQWPLDTGGQVCVRKITSMIRPAVADLQALAAQLSPAGLLAQTVLAIRENRTTPLLQEWETQWRQAQQTLVASPVFSPLAPVWQKEPLADDPRSFILREANQLLNKLLAQTKNRE